MKMNIPITILIVDDQEIVRKLICVALKGSLDAVFLKANDAAEALKSAREHRGSIDLLVSDVVMPGRMNGIEMAAQLSHARPEMKVGDWLPVPGAAVPAHRRSATSRRPTAGRA
jgi:CheY-like chemotaxis protein